MKKIVLLLVVNLFFTLTAWAQPLEEKNFLYQDKYGKYYIDFTSYSVLRDSNKQIIYLRFPIFSLTAVFNNQGLEKVQELANKDNIGYKNEIIGKTFNITIDNDDILKGNYNDIYLRQDSNFYLHITDNQTFFYQPKLSEKIIAFIDKQTPTTPANYLWLMQDGYSAIYLDENSYNESITYDGKKVVNILVFPIVEYHTEKTQQQLAKYADTPADDELLYVTYDFKIDVENARFIYDNYTYHYASGKKSDGATVHFPLWQTFAQHYYKMKLSSIGISIFQDRTTQLIAALNKTPYSEKLAPLIPTITQHAPHAAIMLAPTEKNK